MRLLGMINAHQHKSINVLNYLTMSRFSGEISGQSKTINLSHKTFLQIFRVLNEQNIEYILTGSLAIIFQGINTECYGIELWISPKQQDIEFLKQLFDIEISEHTKEETFTAKFNDESFQLTLRTDLNYFGPRDFKWCLDKAEKAAFDDLNMPVLNLDDLIKETIASKSSEKNNLLSQLEDLTD